MIHKMDGNIVHLHICIALDTLHKTSYMRPKKKNIAKKLLPIYLSLILQKQVIPLNLYCLCLLYKIHFEQAYFPILPRGIMSSKPT